MAAYRMFDAFQKRFPVDPGQKSDGSIATPINDPELRAFFDLLGGASFAGGLYRTISAGQSESWKKRVEMAFPEFDGKIACFGFDWLGRTFALDKERPEDGRPGVVMFEPGTGEALEIPVNLVSFHESELVEYGEAALAISFHEKWLASGGTAPRHDQCVGYRVPLFLGGADDVENLEVSDIDVYWHLAGQLIRKARGLPPVVSN